MADAQAAGVRPCGGVFISNEGKRYANAGPWRIGDVYVYGAFESGIFKMVSVGATGDKLEERHSRQRITEQLSPQQRQSVWDGAKRWGAGYHAEVITSQAAGVHPCGGVFISNEGRRYTKAGPWRIGDVFVYGAFESGVFKMVSVSATGDKLEERHSRQRITNESSPEQHQSVWDGAARWGAGYNAEVTCHSRYAAARSVHLSWRPCVDDVVAFYNEACVEKCTPGSYFMACGFDGGYFGIQELRDGTHRVLFSIWDAGSEMHQGRDDPTAIAAAARVEILHCASDARVGRFGGEGTGAQCFDDASGWDTGAKVCFLVEHQGCLGGRAAYAAFVKVPGKSWKHLASYHVAHGRAFRGFHSFVEDFRRDHHSVFAERRAHFGPAWFRSADGTWTAAAATCFTGSGAEWERPDNIDTCSGPAPGTCILATGGEELDGACKLHAWSDLEAGISGPPVQLPKANFPAGRQLL